MELRDLRNFIVEAKGQHFGLAAKKLHVTRPAVSGRNSSRIWRVNWGCCTLKAEPPYRVRASLAHFLKLDICVAATNRHVYLPISMTSPGTTFTRRIWQHCLIGSQRQRIALCHNEYRQVLVGAEWRQGLITTLIPCWIRLVLMLK